MKMIIYTLDEMKRAFETGRNFQLTGENNFQELIDVINKANKNFVLADVSGTSSLIHHCGNELTEKEIFHDHCLKCSEYISED